MRWKELIWREAHRAGLTMLNKLRQMSGPLSGELDDHVRSWRGHVSRGPPSRVVMDVLGHSQIGVTMNAYTPSVVDEAPAATDPALGVAAEK